MPSVTVNPTAAVTVTLTEQEAKMLRRICNFNKTISERLSETASDWHATVIDAFMCQLGSQLKERGFGRKF